MISITCNSLDGFDERCALAYPLQKRRNLLVIFKAFRAQVHGSEDCLQQCFSLVAVVSPWRLLSKSPAPLTFSLIFWPSCDRCIKYTGLRPSWRLSEFTHYIDQTLLWQT